MLDAHVHIERGPYSESWVDAFVERAQAVSVDELHLLEHSFRFYEFRKIYDSVEKHGDAGDYQSNWLSSRCCLGMDEYKRLVSTLRNKQYPIIVKFGLEVCYLPESEEAIRQIVSDFDWDFLTGAIHWVDGFGFDHKENIPIWLKSDVNKLYHRYYTLMVLAIKSGIFDVIAHPDSIKCFDFYPSDDLSSLYREVAENAKMHLTLLAGDAAMATRCIRALMIVSLYGNERFTEKAAARLTQVVRLLKR